MPGEKRSNWIKTFFFGNYFYGLCIVALSIEACLQQEYSLNNIIYYILAFIATVLYYTKAYIPARAVNSPNSRTRWYARNKSLIIKSQWILTLIFLSTASGYLYIFFDGIINMPWLNWLLLIIIPAIAFLYYGIDHHFFGSYSLRSIGWLKPFVIGLIWAAVATIYPIIFHGVETNGGYYQLNLVGTFLFIKNFMFVSVLCIMFDIKDYADDSNKRIKTFVVNVGLRKTIFYILIPLVSLGVASFLGIAFLREFSNMKIFMNLIPFILLIVVAYWMHRRQSIFYYLIAIDGLMFTKGICGSIAMIFF